MKRRIFTGLCVLLLLAMASGAWAAAPLKITAVWGYWNSPTPPVDRSLTDYATKLIIDRTGVDCEWPLYPQDWTSTQFWQAVSAAGTIPNVLDVGAMWVDTDYANFITKNNLIWPITAAMIKQYMPNYTARMLKYGRTVEEALAATSNQYKGQNLSIPTQFGFGSFPKLLDNPVAKQPSNDYYSLAFRDDILKKIFPNALSEVELQAKLVKNGKLTINDMIDDIPIKTMDDLYQYLKKVKALNLKVGDKPVIPGAITASSESLGALDWSLRTIIGYAWCYPFMFGTPPNFEDTVYPKLAPEYKEYMKWWNKLYNEQLVDPELFVMKNDQFNAKQINGEYAVLNRWWYVNDARKVGKERGYGYRYFPLFYGQLKKGFYSNNNVYVSMQGSPVAITKTTKQADLPKVLKWIDWYMSEEHDSLAYWGMPTWYKGDGVNRRYLPDHAVLEDWVLYGINGPRDGSYYGLQHAIPAPWNPITSVKFPLGPMSFFSTNQTYPEAPYFVYPKDPAKVLRTTDIWVYQENVMRAARYDELTIFTNADDPYNQIMALPDVAAWETANSNDPTYVPVIVKMVTGSTADFEKNYAAFAQMINNWGNPDGTGTQKALAAAIKFMQGYYKDQIVPKMIKK
jgi:putative aldouronate transport system substrate-binding protein